jgi:hypothetical protein
MTENGIWPGSKYSPETLAVKGKAGMPDREHTAMKAVQATGFDCAIDGATRIPQRPDQLMDRDNPVLAPRKIRQGSMCSQVRRSSVPHSESRVRRTSVLPPAT